jgi:hypothetical protein
VALVLFEASHRVTLQPVLKSTLVGVLFSGARGVGHGGAATSTQIDHTGVPCGDARGVTHGGAATSSQLDPSYATGGATTSSQTVDVRSVAYLGARGDRVLTSSPPYLIIYCYSAVYASRPLSRIIYRSTVDE